MPEGIEVVAEASASHAFRSLAELDQVVLDALPLGVCVCAGDGTILRFNQKALDLWGRAPRVNDPAERFCGSHRLFNLQGEPIPPEATPAARAVREGIACQALEALVENPDGRRWTSSFTVAPLRDDEGAVVGAISCFQNVSAAHELERALQRDRAFLQAIVETTPECVKIVAPDGSLLQMNAAGLAMIGADGFQEVAGCQTVELIAPEHREEWQARHERVCRGERLRWEFDIIGLKGERRHMLTHAAPIELPGGELAQLAVTSDITRRKRDELALRESERVHREILQALPTAIYTTDAEGRITFFNNAAVQFSGRTPRLGDDSWCVTWRLYRADGSFLPHDECPMAVALKERRPMHGVVEAVAERPDGGRSPFLPFATPLFDSEGELIGGVNMLVDITARKEAEERQKVLVDELNHRVKNTLATVQSIAAQTLRDSETLDEFRPSYEDRLVALSRAHDRLSRTRWQGADVRDLLADELDAFGRGRVVMEGPSARLSPTAAVTFSMIVHELATNAAKYGALSNPDGELAVRWALEAGDLVLEWREVGGPRVSPPTRRGFGTRLVERGVQQDLGGASVMAFESDGLRCSIRFPMAAAAAQVA